MKASNDQYGHLRRALQDAGLEWIVAVAEREHELDRLLEGPEADGASSLGALVGVLTTAVTTAERAETAIPALLGEAVGKQRRQESLALRDLEGEPPPSKDEPVPVRFAHPLELQEEWWVWPPTAPQRDLAVAVRALSDALAQERV